MDPFIKKIVGTLVRTALTFLAGWLVQRGLLTATGSTEFVEAALLILTTLGWSIWQKYRGLLMIQAAKVSPTNASMADIKEVALSGKVNTTGLTTPSRPGTDRPNG